MSGRYRRRRRRSASTEYAAGGGAGPQDGSPRASTAPVADLDARTVEYDADLATAESALPGAAAGPAADRPSHPDERGLRGLVGAGSSQIGASAALRARDAARPTAEHLAAAEKSVRIIRRNWVPHD